MSTDPKEPTVMWLVTTLYPVRWSCFFSRLHPSTAMCDFTGGARGSLQPGIWADFKDICNLRYHSGEQNYKKQSNQLLLLCDSISWGSSSATACMAVEICMSG